VRAFVQAIPHPTGLRRSFEKYLQGQIDVAVKLGLDKSGMRLAPTQSNPSLGLAKQHGVAGDQRCGSNCDAPTRFVWYPTREEAQQLLKISVAQAK